MDFTFDNLPYQIPGPAGTATPLSQTSTQPNHPRKPSTISHFRTPPWQAALHTLDAPPHGPILLSSSIALLCSNALSDRFQRLSKLPVLIDSLSWVGRDASVTLRDPTASIRATLHAELFSKYKRGVEMGAVIVLEGVAAVAYMERRPSGFRTDEAEGLHVSIQACHVSALFGVTCEHMRLGMRGEDPRESYEIPVRKPPVIRRPPSRRVPVASMVSPVRRQPLRQRIEPQQGRRPGSGVGANYVNRGGFQALGQQQRPATPGRGMYNATGKRPYGAWGGTDNEGGRGMGQTRRPGMQPVRNIGMQSVRRPGMQPLPKRPMADRGRGVGVGIGWNRDGAGSQGRDSESLTDEQLDSLLGDVDVDAVIAASGRNPVEARVAVQSEIETGDMATGLSPPPSSRGNAGSVLGAEKGSASLDSTRPLQSYASEAALAVIAEKAVKEKPVGERIVSKPNTSQEGQVKQSTTASETNGTSKDMQGGLAQDTQAERAGQRELSKADEAMIDSLLDGLDGSEFV